MAKKKIIIGNKVFETQSKAEAFVREILKELEPQAEIDNSSSYWDFFHELIEKHPQYEEKHGPGISKFLIGRSFRKHLELNLLWIDNEKMDISWLTCISGRAATPFTNLKEAMRVAVKDQIDIFRSKALASEAICGICEKKLEGIDDLHIDHEIQFQKLVQDFNAIIGRYPIEFNDEPITNRAMFKDSDLDYAKQWKQYHFDNAKLRISHSKCNLTRKKS